MLPQYRDFALVSINHMLENNKMVEMVSVFLINRQKATVQKKYKVYYKESKI